MSSTLLATIASTVLGGFVFTVLMALGVWVLVRQARDADILAPVLCGLGLRLVVMLVVHAASVQAGDGGLMFLDDKTYLWDGMTIAEEWRVGHFVDPAGFDYAGTPMYGYQAICAAVFVLVADILAGKLVNVLASSAVVLCVGLIAGRIWGTPARRRAAWAAALLPGLIWWSSPLMKEAVASLLFVATLLAMLSLGRPRALPALIMLFALLAVTRTAAAVSLLVAAGPVFAWVLLRDRADIDLPRLARRVLVVLGVAGIALYVFSRGDVGGLLDSYTSTVDEMVASYRDGGLLHVPVSVVQSLISPYPWVFDEGTHNWDLGLYPAMWLWYALYPLAGLALVRHIRRPEVALLAAIIVVYLVINAVTSGFVFRQRSTVEPIILLLAVGGVTSWRTAGAVAAGAWAFVALPAAVQSPDPVTVVAILGAAGCAALAARRLPSGDVHVCAPDAVLAAARGLATLRLHQPHVRVPLRRRAAADPARAAEEHDQPSPPAGVAPAGAPPEETGQKRTKE